MIAALTGHTWHEVFLDEDAPPQLGRHPWHRSPPIVLDTSAAKALGYRPVGDYATTITDEIGWMVDQVAQHPTWTPPGIEPETTTRWFDYAARHGTARRITNAACGSAAFGAVVVRHVAGSRGEWELRMGARARDLEVQLSFECACETVQQRQGRSDRATFQPRDDGLGGSCSTGEFALADTQRGSPVVDGLAEGDACAGFDVLGAFAVLVGHPPLGVIPLHSS